MAHTVSLTINGQTVTVNSELLEGYIKESNEHLDAIVEANAELKLIGEALEEKTHIKAATILKYIKARHKNKTKEATELGEIFGAIDGALES